MARKKTANTPADPGAHYRGPNLFGIPLDPYRILEAYPNVSREPARHMLKKILRMGKKGIDEPQLVAELQCCLDRWKQMLEEEANKPVLPLQLPNNAARKALTRLTKTYASNAQLSPTAVKEALAATAKRVPVAPPASPLATPPPFSPAAPRKKAVTKKPVKKTKVPRAGRNTLD